MLRVQNSGPRFIKDYEGHKLLGAGAFGAVIRVKNRLDKKMYAIKITSDGGFGIDVIREVENLGKIPFHKNVVGYMTSWVDTLSRPEIQFLASLENSSSSKFKSVLDSNRLRVLCIQMELCGEDLRDWLSKHPSVSESRCTDIFRQISNGVQHIHKHNLIHRDLKPDNVFFGFNDRNTIKIGDFGIAASHNGTSAASHTGKFGTLIYLAPEQNTTTYGKKVDLYALGLILFELFYPPAQNRLAESFNKIKFDKELPQTIKQNWPHVSNLILGLTSSDPNKRPTFDIIFDTLDGRSTGQSNISGSSRISRGVKYSSVIHEHVICDGCLATPIRGIRYKCSVCTNYDLCEKCKAKPGIHPLTHSMIKITEKSRTNEDVRDSLIIHEHVGCNVCLAKPIRGIRYKCSVCSNYDLCEKCEAKPGIHPSTHSMIKMKVPKKYSVSNQISRGLNYSKNDSGFYNYDYYYDDDDDEDLRSNLARLSLGASRIARNRDGDKVRKGKPGGSGGDTGLNSSRLYYCGRRKYECRCGCCDGRCGPNNGCPCDACLELVM